MNFKGTVVGLIPENWIIDTMENSLEEIIDYRGKTPEKSDSGIITLSAKSVKNGYIDYGNAYYISDETYKKFMVRGFPEKGDVLLTTEAPLGCVAKLDRDDVGLAQRLLTLRGKARYLDNDYLRYYLMSDIGQHQLKSRESGTTVTGIKQSEFRKAYVVLPPFNEQCGIAATLSCLDDKIELNNRMNKNLEEMAQAIFKSWFVDFEPFQEGEFEESELGMIPKGWRVGKAEDFFEISIGKTPPRKESQWFSTNKNDVKWVSISDMGKSGTYILNTSEYLTDEAIKKHNVKIVPSNTIILSFKLTVGRVAITSEKMATNEAIAHFKTKKKNTNEFLLCYLKSFNYDSLGNTSSIATAVNSKVIKAMTMMMPTESVLNEYYNIVNPLISGIRKNEIENQKLIETRDTLLPKLMSGEIRVPIEEVQ